MQSSADAERQVIEWLKQVPFSDLDDHHKPPKDKMIDYKAWFRLGKQIKGAEEVLQKLLQTRDSRIDLAQVAYALGWIGGSQSVPMLLDALGSDNLRVRIEAAASLGRLGDARAVKSLCTSLNQDKDHNVRANAAVALGMIGDPQSRPCLQQALSDEDSFVRGLVKKALERLKKI